MDKENQKVEKVDDTQKDGDTAIDLSQMTREEVEAFAVKQAEEAAKNEKAYKDQKGLNDKLKSKLKDSEVTETTSITDNPVDNPTINPEKTTKEAPSLDEQYVIASLSKQFSLEEIKEAQSFVGTSFGTTLSDVAVNPGFLAHINAKRELTKSDSMIDDKPIHIETYQSKEEFVKDVESGNIDITQDLKSYEKYVAIKAKQESDKNFTG